MFELSMWRCSDELLVRANELHRSSKKDSKHYIEFWKKDPPSEPYRVILSDVNALELCFRSLCSCGDRAIADGSLLDFLRQVSTFGLSLVRLDIRKESDRHTEVMDAITNHLENGSYKGWSEERRQEWLRSELVGKRPLFGPDLPKKPKKSLTCWTPSMSYQNSLLTAILSQPPDTIQGSLRVIFQEEVMEQSFGEEHLCFRTLQRYPDATLEHGMHPPVSPKSEWRALMDEMAIISTEKYRSIVFKEPRFVEYFRLASPELEFARMNIGSRPSKRKPSGGIESLRAIPWIFAWTQTRFHLPVWLGVTIDLVEMVFAKGDPGIAALYDKLLASEDLWSFGQQLRADYEETKSYLLKIAGHRDLLEGNPYLKQRLRLRQSYITALNVCQAYTLKRIRDPNYHVTLRPHLSREITDSRKPAAELVKLNPTSEYAPGLEDTLILTMKGIAAGMQNTG
ncbi:hypothetical protein C5167_047856 [Papaver somniferum]|uniref:Phosphoenolpyruvate carboxylase n=1 Tax=Papaver somniferum TaxID=3469 RepID=A0A4Y7LKB4_PAPSO|nr:hypothetical protein C5167_047856 [Papaver somniferum]